MISNCWIPLFGYHCVNSFVNLLWIRVCVKSKQSRHDNPLVAVLLDMLFWIRVVYGVDKSCGQSNITGFVAPPLIGLYNENLGFFQDRTVQTSLYYIIVLYKISHFLITFCRHLGKMPINVEEFLEMPPFAVCRSIKKADLLAFTTKIGFNHVKLVTRKPEIRRIIAEYCYVKEVFTKAELELFPSFESATEVEI